MKRRTLPQKVFASPAKTRTGQGSSRPIYSRAKFKSSFTPVSYKPPPSVEAAEVCLSIVLGFTSTSYRGLAQGDNKLESPNHPSSPS